MREQVASPIPKRASRPVTQDYPVAEDDAYYPKRLPTSARRYTTTQGHRVIQQGNRRIVIHDEPPPRNRNIHWMVYIGIGMIVMLALFVGFQMLSAWWTNHQLDSTYGMPRTYQTDQVVGHGDSSDHPTHFIFENLGGHVVIIELPGGQIQHARIYGGPAIIGDNPALLPVTAEFQDVNGDGRVDMIVHIGNQQFTYINDGTEFKPQQ